MKRPQPRLAVAVLPVLLLAGISVTTAGCRNASHTAGRPAAEKDDGLDGSVTSTKEGTGDPKVGAGRGQVGTDAPPRASDTQPPDSSPKPAR